MRRADRLFQIIQILRRRRVVTAAQLAEVLEVSERTIYRDINEINASGTRIDGEAGVGYRLGAGYDLPPLMFTEDEVQALALGVRIVMNTADEALARGARSALSKIDSALTDELRARIRRTRLFMPYGHGARISKRLLKLRQAIDGRRTVKFAYRREDGELTERVARPLGAFFWGRTWTILAWCELRDDFRSFRVDRMQQITTGELFESPPGQTLDDYLAQYQVNEEKLGGW